MFMENGMMGGGMMIGMGLVWLLTITVLFLGVIALLKYIRSDDSK
ncbi:MAG: hypothetical protein V7763_07220 [Sulfitobacter sp.]|jgi:uncharacterized membrane protein|tara:strand:- start:3437 stop:3571 length:135 start_codon:yes stop_codon:yes gene_type:complete